MHEIASPFADSITIPATFTDSIKRALYAVDNIQGALVGNTLKELFSDTSFIFPDSDSTHLLSAGNDISDAFIIHNTGIYALQPTQQHFMLS